ncbi:DUF4129 domain-containing protein [Natronolimnohabitans innermongolicus]|uniref:DUF4129 domain-containing protein n=1 Tax=Natronolimnohabitans innermongolicus JCM 12255 TaxID=1227499 RepID=L9WV01_9EURY|nr:DUF4129 domain-containing protein [Natronolimnohabitans innermongolicus]ELY53252.1 hypothetical protein C493_14518 [Natronolimnohabitans innermongolicus JCM 12255]
MAAGSGSGRRLLAVGAVCCAIVGLVLAASAMPMLASESPGSGVFDGDSQTDLEDGEAQSEPPLAPDGADQGDGGSDGSDRNGGSGTGGEFGDDSLSGALADRAAGADNSLVEGALYGFASVLSLFDDTGGIDGEFGSELESDDLEDLEEQDDIDPPEDADEFDDLDESDVDLDDDAGGSDGATDADGDDGDDIETGDDAEYGNGDDDVDGDNGSADGTDGGDGDGESGDGSDTDDGQTDDVDGSDEVGDTDAESGDTDDDPLEAPDHSSADQDGSDDDADDESDDGAGGTEDGGDESSLEDAVPGLSGDGLTAAIVAIVLLSLGYIFYTRENPIEVILSLPGRVVSLALSAVIACSQALERALGRLRELRSLAELPGLVLAALTGAVRSASDRVTSASASLFGRGATADEDEIEPTQTPARERIRRAFESVIDAAPMYRGRVATATPAEVASRATEAGAPSKPVETITDSFRDVEYGDRDPETYLEPTATAHDELRSALENEASDGGGDGDDADDDHSSGSVSNGGECDE